MRTKIASLKRELRFGTTPAMATPLEDDGYRVNTAVIPQLVEFLITKGASSLFVGGTTGEGILLDVAERQRLAEATLTAVNKQLPVIIHAGANRTSDTITLAKHAATCHADAIAVVSPYFYGMHEESLLAYYHTIAKAVPDTPLLLYDIPHLAVNGITPSLLARATEQIPSVAGVKTSRSDAQIIRQLIDAAPEYAIILAGNERIALGLLALGVDGLISGLSTAVPEPFVALTQAFGKGDLHKARQQQKAINLLLDQMPAGTRIGAIKAILTERGIEMGTAVPPRPMPNKPLWPAMAQLLI
ncbi:MAG: 4-hydroxy-tetrahydrodipicolinate synthase [Candidatus Promineifilaceae bacterium]